VDKFSHPGLPERFLCRYHDFALTGEKKEQGCLHGQGVRRHGKPKAATLSEKDTLEKTNEEIKKHAGMPPCFFIV
jgi:hypothetical protein